MEKVLTVSIAAYNDEKYIRETLESVINDERIIDKIEVLVCDDGGKDSTLDIVREYSAKYPDSVFPVHKENGGYGSVINHNVRLARGKYFKQLDGDDWFKTENMMEFINVLESTDADCVYTQRMIKYEKTNTYETDLRFNHLPNGEYSYKDTPLKKLATMHGSTLKTQLLKDIDLKITEKCLYTDTEFISLALPKSETFYNLNLPIYIYRIGREGQSVSVEGWRKHYKEHEIVFWNMVKIYNSIDPSEKNKRDLLLYRLFAEYCNNLKMYSVLKINKQNFNDLKSFANKVKTENPEIYEYSCKNSRFANLLAKTNYLSYPFMKLFLDK